MYECYIYRHWVNNSKNKEKNYIGQTINRKPQQRWGRNGNGYLKGEKDHKFARAIKKYGWDSFNHSVLLVFKCNTKEEIQFWADEWEKYYIEKYDSYYNGYNSTLGGQGQRGWEGLKGQENPMYGKKHDDSVKRKMSEAQKELVASENYKNPFAGKQHTDITKEKIGQSIKQHYSEHEHPWKNRKHTEETKKKISEVKKGTQTLGDNPRAKKVRCINTGKCFSCMEEARMWCVGLSKSQPIAWVCQGKRRTAGKHPVTGEKLSWEFIE